MSAVLQLAKRIVYYTPTMLIIVGVFGPLDTPPAPMSLPLAAAMVIIGIIARCLLRDEKYWMS